MIQDKMTLQEIEKFFEGYKLHGPGPYLVVSKMGWLIEKVKELEFNIKDPEWCCAEHKRAMAERIKDLEFDLSLNKSGLRVITPEDVISASNENYDLGRKHGREEMTEELKLNSSMLARQTDLAREAESKWMEAQNELSRMKEEEK